MALVMLIVSIALVIGGYQIYSKKVDREIIQADPKRATPATLYNDGVDFMPASASVLFGYQFKSIAALGPIVGPIVAVQYGWLPAIIWIFLGVLFIGWVQDYGSAMLAMRNDGMTMGGLSYRFISPRARGLLLSFLYIYLLLIMGAFGALIAPILAKPIAPVGFIILVIAGVLAGQMTYRWKVDLMVTTVVTVLLALAGIWFGTTAPAQDFVKWINGLGPDPFIRRPLGYGDMSWANFFWAIVMLVFCYLGSVLPIWQFAQPVNYTSFWFVLLGLVGSMLGIVVAAFTGSVNTSFEIPAWITAWQPHLGPIWPILFVTIACGAISGWHSLVSTSGTARQLEKETDALPVGGGAMFMEGVLAALSTIFAATFALSGKFYDPAQGYKLVKSAGGVFVYGMAHFMNVIGFPVDLGSAIGIVFLVVMALTVMQLVLRFMRVASAELLGDRIPAFKNPHFGTIVAELLTLFIIVFGFWQWIWVLFGGSNQVFAGIALLLLSIWLASEGRAYNWTFIPGIFMYITTLAALLYVTVYNALWKGVVQSWGQGNTGFIIGNLISAAFGLYMVIAALMLLLDGLKAFNKAKARQLATTGD